MLTLGRLQFSKIETKKCCFKDWKEERLKLKEIQLRNIERIKIEAKKTETQKVHLRNILN